MIMVTGGAFAGKREFVKKQFGLREEDIIRGEDCSPEDVFAAKCVDHYERIIRRIMDGGAGQDDVCAFTDRLLRENPGVTVIMDEIGSGIIPLDKSERLWREQTGRAGCRIAAAADTVIRVCCGIPSVIKST